MSAKYQVPLRDGKGGMMDVTVKNFRVYDENGKDIGHVKSFPGLKPVGGTGSFFDGAKGGKYDTETAEIPAPGGEADDEGTRVGPTGMRQSGKKLGIGDINGLFASLSDPERKGGAKMTAGELPAASKFFSEALPLTEEGARQQGHGSLVTGPDGNPMKMETGTWDDEKGAIIPPSVPGTTGGKPENPEDGTSSKPDIAEGVRSIRMHRNKRDQLEGFSADEPFGGVSETKGNGMTASRRAAVSAFLDPNNKGYGAIRARDRAVGAYDQFGTGGMNIDGQDVKFKEGMSADARFELAGGKIQSKEDAQDFLKKFTNRMSKPQSTEE